MNAKGGIGAVLNLYAQHFISFEVLYTYPENKAISRLPFYVKALLRLMQKLKSDHSIEIVHIHTASNGSFYRKSIALLIAKIYGKKTVMHIHGGGFKEFYNSSLLKTVLIRPILSTVDQVICLSDEWFDFFSNQLQLKNTVVLTNPIALPRIHAKAIKSNQIELIYFGAVVESKGIFDLINYLPTNRHFIEGKILLHVCGEGDLEKLRSIVKLHRLENNIFIHGWVSGSSKFDLFHQADIFILPSYAEGLPMSILEAMSFGKPIIATKVGGIPSLVHPEYNGWLYAPNNIHELTLILDNLFSNLAQIDVFGQHSRQLSLSYDIHTISNKLQKIYTTILSK